MTRIHVALGLVCACAIVASAAPVIGEPMGSVVAWGLNDHGQCASPPLNDNFVAIAGGGLHSVGLRADGSVTAWGWNDAGQCSDLRTTNADFVAVAAGFQHSLGLKGDGTAASEIAAWGSNAYGQCPGRPPKLPHLWPPQNPPPGLN